MGRKSPRILALAFCIVCFTVYYFSPSISRALNQGYSLNTAAPSKVHKDVGSQSDAIAAGRVSDEAETGQKRPIPSNVIPVVQEKEMVLEGHETAEITHRVWMDITHGSRQLGRIVFGLYGKQLPITVENFRLLCTGERGFGYTGSPFHRIIAGFMVQGGDFTEGTGRGGHSIYQSGRFADEGFRFPHSGRGALSMANSGKDTNGSQFFVTFKETKWLNGRHVVFGRVLAGWEVLAALENVQTEGSRPKEEVVVKMCGQLAETESI